MSDPVKQPKWYKRFGIEMYQIMEWFNHKMKPMEITHCNNHLKYLGRLLDKHESIDLIEQDFNKADETWQSFKQEFRKRFPPKSSPVTGEWIEDPLHDED